MFFNRLNGKSKVILLALICIPVSASNLLDEGFKNPPQNARPQLWWHWMYGNITKEGITKDLELMQKLGIGGVTQFHNAWTKSSWKRPETPRGPIRFMSEEYRKLIKYSLKECERLDMTMGLHICDGFSQMGGPWVKPDQGMRSLQCTVVPVTAGKTLVYETPDDTVLILAYQGTIEAPSPQELKSSESNKNIQAFRRPMVNPQNPYLENKTSPITQAIKSNECVDLTKSLNKDGILTWDPPQGDWFALFFHHVLHEATNHPASPEGHGLECNKLNSDTVDVVYDKVVGPLIEDAGSLAGKTLKHVLVDSWECGYQSWTKGFAEEFQRRRGYDLAPYLPVLANIPVDSVEVSNRFLCDFRVTLDDLLAEEYYGHVRDRLHEKGLQLHAEVLYGWAQMFGNSIRQYGVVDVPMNEIWMHRKLQGERAFTSYAAASAHVYGKQIIKDESFTVGSGKGNFSFVPSDIKSRADFLLCRGTNRFVLHTSTHQPYDQQPGWTHGWNGVNFHRGNTWWPYAGGLVDYLGRTSYMLQQGLFVADVCRYVGHEDTFSKGYGELPIEDLPEGYRADHCDNTVLLELMDVKDGRIVLPDGMSYAILLLADKKNMAPEILEKLTKLVEKGAIVIGPKPESAPGLKEYPECDKIIQEMANKLWGKSDSKINTEHRFGKGRVVWGKPLSDLLNEMDLVPDFICKTAPENSKVNFIHRKLPYADIYFLATAGQACIADCTFRVAGKQPELFDPMTGNISDISVYEEQDGQTRIPLKFEAQGSKIIVFRKKSRDSIVEIRHNGEVLFAPGKLINKEYGDLPATFNLGSDNSIAVTVHDDCKELEWKMASGREGRFPETYLPKPVYLTGSWTVNFEADRGAPNKIEVDNLLSWTEHANSGVRHFSGIGTYSKTFLLPDNYQCGSNRIWLELGEVRDLAEVIVNDKSAGTLWRAPFKVDITSHVQPGQNKLKIEVVNTWVNRLIGDKKVPKSKWICEMVSPNPKWYDAKSELRTSGLLGPAYIYVTSTKYSACD